MLLAVDLHDYNLSLYLYIKKPNIFRFFSSKKFMKISSKTHQNPPFKKKLSTKHAPEPPEQTLGNATRRKQIRGMQLVHPSKKMGPLANTTYAHGLLLRNLFEEMCW